jgi:four helix bundle protein
MARFHGDLPERTYQFGLAIAKLVDRLPNNVTAWEFGKQVLRSGASVGANIEEANCALTNREFIQMCNIARRESLETRFWLRMMKDTGLLTLDDVQHWMTEADELAKILSAVIIKTRRRDDT